METELLLSCSFNPGLENETGQLDSLRGTAKQDGTGGTFTITYYPGSPCSMWVAFWVVRFSAKRMGILFNCAITILTKARTRTIRKSNYEKYILEKVTHHSWFEILSITLSRIQKRMFYSNTLNLLIGGIWLFRSTLDWLKVLYCHHRIVA